MKSRRVRFFLGSAYTGGWKFASGQASADAICIPSFWHICIPATFAFSAKFSEPEYDTGVKDKATRTFNNFQQQCIGV